MNFVLRQLFKICLVVVLYSPLPSIASMSLQGEVVDESGEPIDHVTLHVRENYFDPFSESFRSSSESKKKLKKGKFRISCFRCSTVSLFFMKSGFYAETVEFSNATRETTEPQPRDALRIVLKRDWTVKLTSYHAYLRSTPDGPITVAPIRRDLGKDVSISDLKKHPEPGSFFLPGYIQLKVERTRDSELITIDFSQLEDGGIVLYQHSKEYPQKIYPEMKDAPTEGYQKTLVLNRKNRGGGYYFYCKIGDIYGKGRIANPSLISYEHDRVLTALIDLELNYDGTPRL